MSVSLIDGHIDDDAPRMTDNEIIKALECCRNGLCADCPRLNTPAHILLCKEQLMCETLDLINRQKAEIERLKNDLAKEFVCFVGSPHKVEHCPFFDELENERAEAVKEFAERLKEKAVHIYSWLRAVDADHIDNLVKEMVGDAE